MFIKKHIFHPFFCFLLFFIISLFILGREGEGTLNPTGRLRHRGNGYYILLCLHIVYDKNLYVKR